MQIVEELDKSRNFGDVFELVKKAAERSLGRRRAGLMLYLAELPRQVGAFHTLGTNGIVMNKSALNMVTRSARSLREINGYVFSILLHEYLHALGYVPERTVRPLVYEICKENLGADHPATRISKEGPSTYFPGIVEHPEWQYEKEQPDVEIITDFDRSSQRYIG